MVKSIKIFYQKEGYKMNKKLIWSVSLISILLFGPFISKPALSETPQDIAIDKGLEWLKGKQKPGGYWEYCPIGVSDEQFAMPARVGTTGLVILAFINGGYDPLKSVTVEAGLDYILSQCNSDGSIYDDIPVYPDTWAMSYPVYETSTAVYALVAAWSVTPTTERPPTWQTAIIDAANYLMDPNVHLSSGGWGYKPGGSWYETGWVDLSNTQFAVLALKAVLESDVSDAILKAKIQDHLSDVENTVDFISSCQNPDGGFYYRPGEGEEWTGGPSYGSMTAALDFGLSGVVE
jgi:hypothetical protein